MRCVVLSSLGMMLAMLPLAFAAGASDKTVVSLGTATPGGGFPVYGEAVAATINGIDPTLEVKPQNTMGSAENVPMLESGKLDIALVQGEAALEAFNGIGRPPADLRILAAMYATPGMFVVRADSPASTSSTARTASGTAAATASERPMPSSIQATSQPITTV